MKPKGLNMIAKISLGQKSPSTADNSARQLHNRFHTCIYVALLVFLSFSLKKLIVKIAFL